MKKLICIMLCLALVTALWVAAEDSVPAYSMDFTASKSGDPLPQGYTVRGGSVTMQDGYLQLAQGSVVTLPESLNYKDFTLEIDFTISQANESTRWAAFMYRGSVGMSTYMQMCVRQGAAASNGVEIAANLGNGWQYNHTAAGPESIQADKVYTAKIVASGSQIAQYVDGMLINKTTEALMTASGIFGVQTNGSTLRVYGIRIREAEDLTDIFNRSVLRDVYKPETDLILPPTVMQTVDTPQELAALKEDQTPPQAAWFRLKGTTPVKVTLGDTEETLDAVREACKNRIIPVLEITDVTMAQEVVTYLKNTYETDVYIASSNIEALQTVMNSKLPYLYMIYMADSADSLSTIARNTHSSAALAVALDYVPAREDVEYLQKRFITVTLCPAGVSDENIVRAAVDSGANGLVVQDGHTAYEMYAQVEKATYVRKPFVVGHRGLPLVAPENTVEGMKEAYKAGADAVECDVYLTKDDHVVINHNGTLTGYTTDSSANQSVERMTREELKSYTLKAVGKYDRCQFAFLDEMYEVLKEYPDKMLVVEIKTGQSAVVERIYELANEYGVLDQIVVISFSASQLQVCRQDMPEVGVSLLMSVSGDGNAMAETILASTARAPMGCSPSGITLTAIRSLHYRGVSCNVWTVNGAVALINQARNGAMFLTTDNSDVARSAADGLALVDTVELWGPAKYDALPGDVNGDKTVNAVDALLVLQHAVDKITLTKSQQTVAELTKDGKIDAVDALQILKIAVGKE